MSIYSFIYKKLNELINERQTCNQSIRIGFGERHTDNFIEMASDPSKLKIKNVNINAKHLFLSTQGDNATICIEDHGRLDVSDECFEILQMVNDEFRDDFIDDSTSRWKFFVFDDFDKIVYELDIVSMQILNNEEEAIIQCKNCKKKPMAR